MTTNQQFHDLGKLITGKLYQHLAILARDHGMSIVSVADGLNASVFDIGAVMPGKDGGAFEGRKFKLTLSLMPVGYEDGNEG